MTNSELNRFGIVIRGKISDWTKDIVNEYKTNFPNAQIVVSTWSNENTDDINAFINNIVAGNDLWRIFLYAIIILVFFEMWLVNIYFKYDL